MSGVSEVFLGKRRVQAGWVELWTGYILNFTGYLMTPRV